MNTDYTDLLDRERHQLQNALARTAGLDLRGGYLGTLKCGRRNATVRFEPGDSIRVSLDVRSGLTARDALGMSASLAGNVRFSSPSGARSSGALRIVAETRVDGIAHLPETFQGISESIRGASKRRPRPFEPDAPPLERETVAKALTCLDSAHTEVVELGDEWEIRPRSAGSSVPVRMATSGGGVRLYRALLAKLPEGLTGAALCEEALRAGGALRLARFAVCGNALVAETCLHSGQVDASWIALSARAVATAFAYCRPRLRVLSENDRVARCYAELCCPPIARN